MVYFLQAVNLKLIKIGYCKDARLDARINAIKTGCPDELILLGFIPKAEITVEYNLHQEFKTFRVRGEWFNPSKKLINFIEINNGTYGISTRAIEPRLSKEMKKIRKLKEEVGRNIAERNSKVSKIKYPTVEEEKIWKEQKAKLYHYGIDNKDKAG